MPQTSKGLERRYVMLQCMAGDSTSDEVLWYCLDAEPNKFKWAQAVAKALLPGRISVFPRQRWVNSFSSIQANVLLTLFNILQRAVPRWATKMNGARVLPLRVNPKRSDWDLPPSSDESSGEDNGVAESQIVLAHVGHRGLG